MAEDSRKHLEKVVADFGWAVEIVRKHFSLGLEEICDPRFLNERYKRFESKNDPIYSELLKGMNDKPLAKTFVSYWTIAHTIATQSRLWLDYAVAEIIIHQAKNFGRPVTHLYSQSMLTGGYFEERKTIADIGEYELEHLSSSRPWRPLVQESALQKIDILVGEQERERIGERNLFQMHKRMRYSVQEIQNRDKDYLDRIVESLAGPPATEVTIQCNLLVVEPDRLDGNVHAYGFRFINPKTISTHPARKQERVNMLRMYALLVQEKILRDPKSIHVCIAELLPRYSDFETYDRYPDYFSSVTYWSSDKLWKFIGVPFEVVTVAIQRVAKEFRQRLKEGLRDLLPKEKLE